LIRLSKTCAALAVPLAALAVAGCGGGGSDSTATTAATTELAPALTKADLISQGDAICGEVNAAAGAAEVLAAEGEEVALQVKLSGLYIGMVENIKGLGTPDDEAGYAELSAAADELAKTEGEVKLAAEREDALALEEATTKAGAAHEEFESVAGEYGFTDCGEGPSAPSAAGTGSGSVEEVEEGGVEVAPEEVAPEEVAPEEVAPEEVAPETGGAGGGIQEAAPESGGSAGGTSGGVGPG
jgi:hypothetical protein